MRGLDGIAASCQALVQAMQAPDIAGVLAGSRQSSVQAEVGAVYGFCLFQFPLLQQQRAERMAGRLHPAPWFVVGQVIAQADGLAQVTERGLSLIHI